jgi:hypothetical protein
MAEAEPINLGNPLIITEKKAKTVITALRNYSVDYATSGLYINMIKDCLERKGLKSAYQLCKLLDKNSDKPKFTTEPLTPVEKIESDKIYSYMLEELKIDRENRLTVVADEQNLYEVKIAPGWIRPNRYSYNFSLAIDKRTDKK